MGRRKQLAPQSQLSRMASIVADVGDAVEANPKADSVQNNGDQHLQPPTAASSPIQQDDELNSDEDSEVADSAGSLSNSGGGSSSGSSNESRSRTSRLNRLRCTVCRKQFKHKKSLQRHVQLHTGLRKHKCLLCCAAFVRSDHLRSHVRTHLAKRHSPARENGNNSDEPMATVAEPEGEGEGEGEYEGDIAATVKATEPAAMEKDKERDPSKTPVKLQNGLKVEEASASTNLSASISPAAHQAVDQRQRIGFSSIGQTLGSAQSAAAPSQFLLDTLLTRSNSQAPNDLQQPQAFYPNPTAHRGLSTLAALTFAPSICGFCGGLATKQSEAVYHLIVHCARQEARLVCGVCGQQCNDADGLRSHASRMHTAQVFRCSAIGCGVMSETTEAAEAHFLRVHAQERRSLACVLCPGEVFDRQAELYDHLVAAHFAPAAPTAPAAPPLAPTPQQSHFPAPTQQQQQQQQQQLTQLLHSPSRQRPRQQNKMQQSPAQTLLPQLQQPPSALILSRVAQELSRLCSYCGRQFADERAVLEHQVREHRLTSGGEEDSPTPGAATAVSAVPERLGPSGQPTKQPAAKAQDRLSKPASRVGGGSEQQKNLWCKICDEKFANQKLLEQHKLVHHNHQHHHQRQHFVDQQRQNRASLRASDTNSRAVKASPTTRHCSACARPVSLDSVVKSERAAPLLCEACNVSRATLCPFCVQTFASPAELRTHLAEQHAVSAVPPPPPPPPPTSLTSQVAPPPTASSADSLALAYAQLNSLAFEATKTVMAAVATPAASEATVTKPLPAAVTAAAPSSALQPPQPSTAKALLAASAASSSASRDLTGFYFSKVNGKFTCQVCDRGFTKEDDLTSHRLVHLTALISRTEAIVTSAASAQQTATLADLPDASIAASAKMLKKSTEWTSKSLMTATGTRQGRRASKLGQRRSSAPPSLHRCQSCWRQFDSWKSRYLHQRLRRHTKSTGTNGSSKNGIRLNAFKNGRLKA